MKEFFLEELMALLIYVDTDVFLNFMLERNNKWGEPLAPEAEELFTRAYYGEYEIIISEKTVEEFRGALTDPGQTPLLFTMLQAKDLLRIVTYTAQDLKEAEALDPENRNDALHALLAKKHGAQFVVTRNIRHFKKFSHIIEPKLPKEI